jgi:RimJ/RimL family protein N-acetyltransferase
MPAHLRWARWDDDGMDATIWPFAALRICTPILELRYADDDDLVALAHLAAEGIHDPATMPFSMPWTRVESPELERRTLQHHWSQRASLSRDSWRLPFAVCADGDVLGIQAIEAQHFPVRRTVDTGSWLVRRAQGRGIGTETRAAILHFAFASLGAEEAYSGSFADNAASAAVSRHNGYEANGEEIVEREGQPARMLRWVLTRERWEPRRRDDVVVEGLEPCLPLLA